MRMIGFSDSLISLASTWRAGSTLPLELGLTVGDRRWLLHIEAKGSRVEPDKLSRRHLNLTPAALVRLVLGHTGIDRAASEDGFELDGHRAGSGAEPLSPVRPILRSPLYSATA